MRTKTIDGIEYKDGDEVTCVISGTTIKDAKVSIDIDNDLFICQEHKTGDYVEDRKGYTFSWAYDNAVRDLKPVNKDYEIF